MKTYRYRCWAASLLVSVVACHQASAFDNGNPWFPELGGDSFRIEALFEGYNRDIRFSSSPGWVTTPFTSGPLVSVTGTDPGLSGEGVEEADIVMVRFTYFPMGPVALQFDLGTNGKSSAGDQVLVLGGSGRMLLVNEKEFQLSAQFGGHVVPDFDTKGSGVSSINGPYDIQGQYGFYELSMSLLGSRQFQFRDGIKWTAYGGPRLSMFRGDSSISGYYSDITTTLHYDIKVKQQSEFSLVLGGVYEVDQHFSLRTEARLVHEASISGSLNWSY